MTIREILVCATCGEILGTSAAPIAAQSMQAIHRQLIERKEAASAKLSNARRAAKRESELPEFWLVGHVELTTQRRYVRRTE